MAINIMKQDAAAKGNDIYTLIDGDLQNILLSERNKYRIGSLTCYVLYNLYICSYLQKEIIVDW